MRSGAARRGLCGGAVLCTCSDEKEREERQELAPCMTASTHKASCYEGPHSGVPGHPPHSGVPSQLVPIRCFRPLLPPHLDFLTFGLLLNWILVEKLLQARRLWCWNPFAE